MDFRPNFGVILASIFLYFHGFFGIDFCIDFSSIFHRFWLPKWFIFEVIFANLRLHFSALGEGPCAFETIKTMFFAHPLKYVFCDFFEAWVGLSSLN